MLHVYFAVSVSDVRWMLDFPLLRNKEHASARVFLFLARRVAVTIFPRQVVKLLLQICQRCAALPKVKRVPSAGAVPFG